MPPRLPALAAWLRAFEPPPVTVSRREIVLSGLGAFFGILVAAWTSHHMLGTLNPWFVAPISRRRSPSRHGS